jgi:hypothetical protein
MRTISEQLKQQFKASHQNKAQKNQEFSGVIDKLKDYHGWSITVLYYAALHYVDVYRIHVNDQSYYHASPTRRQQARLEALDKYPPLWPIKPLYIRLKTASEQARYQPTDPYDAVRVEDLRQKFFEPIREAITTLLTN